MGDSPSGGIPGWGSSTREVQPRQRSRPPYLRSVGWAILAWIAALGVVYVIAQVLDLPQLGGWLGLAGFLLGYWFGGTGGGITGGREWVWFVVMLSGVALVFGLGPVWRRWPPTADRHSGRLICAPEGHAEATGQRQGRNDVSHLVVA